MVIQYIDIYQEYGTICCIETTGRPSVLGKLLGILHLIMKRELRMTRTKLDTSEQKAERLKKKLEKRYGLLFVKAVFDFMDEPQITGADLAIWAGVSRQRIHQLLSVIYNGTKRPKRAGLFKKYVNIPHKPQLVGILQRLSRYGTLQKTKDNNIWLVNGLRVRITFTKTNRLERCPAFGLYGNADIIIVVYKNSRFILIPKNPYIKQTSVYSSTVLEGYERWDLLEKVLKSG